MTNEQRCFRFIREREDKSNETLAVVTINAPKVKAVETSQYIDLRDEKGETFATITFPSWVKVSKIGE